MRIERLEIAGFKSFADPVAIVFHQAATAVVGPNGCGKSNIADALFWVLGELGSATIRARGKDLIFGGSELRGPLGVAEVRLEVSGVERGGGVDPSGGANGNGAAGHAAAPGRRVVISRRVDASGGSVYEMDGRRSTRREIQRLFAGTGLVAGSYAMIGQGRVTEVLTSKPDELRLLVEEAAGLGPYRVNRKEAESNLRAAERSLERVRERLGELERLIRRARRDSRAARRVRKLERRAGELELARQLILRNTWLREIGRGEQPLRRLEAEAQRRAASLRAYERFLGSLREERDATQIRLDERNHAAFDWRSRATKAAAVLEEGERAAEQRNAERERLEQEEADLSEAVARRRATGADHARRTRELPARVEALALQVRERSDARVAARDAERRSHLRLEAARREVERLQGAMRTHRMAREQHQESVERLGELRVRLDGERRALEARKAHVGRAEAEALRRQQEAEATALRRRDELRLAERRSQDAAAALEAATSAASDAGRALAETDARLAAQRALVLSREQLGPAAARRLAAAGGEDGPLLGAVGEAIEVEPGYEAAAERLVGAHRLRVRSVEDLLDLAREADDTEPLEVLVSELAASAPSSRAVDGDALRDHVSGADAAVQALVPDAEVVADLQTALTRFRERPALYVTRAGESVIPPGVVRLGRGGPGEGFLSARRELAVLEHGRADAERRLADAGKALEARQAEAGRAGEEREARREALTAAEGEALRRRIETERCAAAVAEVGRQLEELSSRLDRNRDEAERNEASGVRVAEAIERDRALLERAASDIPEREEELDAAREALTTSEDAFQTADQALAREQAIRDEVRRADQTRDREAREDAGRLDRIAAARTRLAADEAAWEERRATAERELEAARVRAKEASRAAERLRARVSELDGFVRPGDDRLRERRGELDAVEERLAPQRGRIQEARALLRHLESEFEMEHGKPLGEEGASLPDGLLDRPVEEVERELGSVRDGLERLGPVNQVAEARLAELEGEREGPAAQLRDVEEGVADGRQAIARQDREARRAFRTGFDHVNRNFDEAFRQLFGGGRAELVRRPSAAAPYPPDAPTAAPNGEPDPAPNGAAPSSEVPGGNGDAAVSDPNHAPADEEPGIEIFAEPPGKKFQSARLLSGGEKAMTAIAFLIALFRYRPAPVCLLDEVDAPLDDPNAQRFAALLDELRQETQLVVITHNRITMEACRHLYGVTMEEPGVSRVISVEIDAEGFDRWVAGEASPPASALPA